MPLQTHDWIETTRTRMRPFEEQDAGHAFVWLSDPDVMRFIPSGADATREDSRQRIHEYREHQRLFGFSKWLILHRETGEPIGDSGLYHFPDGKRIELGFRLARPCWGQGFAIEVGHAWLQWFDTHHPDTPLFADVHAAHTRSRRVLEKLGFAHSNEETVLGMPMLIYHRHAHGTTP